MGKHTGGTISAVGGMGEEREPGGDTGHGGYAATWSAPIFLAREEARAGEAAAGEEMPTLAKADEAAADDLAATRRKLRGTRALLSAVSESLRESDTEVERLTAGLAEWQRLAVDAVDAVRVLRQEMTALAGEAREATRERQTWERLVTLLRDAVGAREDALRLLVDLLSFPAIEAEGGSFGEGAYVTGYVPIDAGWLATVLRQRTAARKLLETPCQAMLLTEPLPLGDAWALVCARCGARFADAATGWRFDPHSDGGGGAWAHDCLGARADEPAGQGVALERRIADARARLLAHA